MNGTISRRTANLKGFDKAMVVASYFGFEPIDAPRIAEKDVEMTRDCGEHPHYDAAEKAALIRTYLEKNLSSLPHPLALAYKKPETKKRLGGYSLHLIDSPTGMSEALLIRTALSILSEAGHKRLSVNINCIGDKESLSTYERELGTLVRKLSPNLTPEFKETIKRDVFNIFIENHPEALALRETAPPSIAYLNTPSRNYFKEVLEYIEALGVEFRLTPELIGNKHHSSHTVFAVESRIDDNEETPLSKILAVGYSYSRLSKRFGMKKEVPMIGVSIFSEPRAGASETSAQTKLYKKLPKPKFYLVQLGREAKMRSIPLIETLRLERIPVYHFLGRDKIGLQLSNAESLSASHLIIIGQKEALDGTATVRNISTRAQETINIDKLPLYLKTISL